MKKIDKKRLFVSFAVIVAVCVFFSANHIIWRLWGFGIVCPFYKLLGIQCAGCGMTRAVFALLRFDIIGAHKYNMLVIPTVAYIMWLFIGVTLRYARHEREPFALKPYALHFLMLGALMLYGVMRII